MRTQESRQKTSAALRAWCLANPDKVRARGAKNSGPNNYRWKGGSSRLNFAVRRLTEHRKWMDAVVRRDGTCVRCGATTDLEAHHKTPLAKLIALHGITTREQARNCAPLWDLNNGETLCERCHCEHHGRKYTPTGKGRRKKPCKVRRSMAGSANPKWKGGLVEMRCPVCDGAFYVKPVEVTKKKCCSRRCLGESQRKRV